METNKIDKIFNDTFKSREITPSYSAWERMETRLDKHQEQKRKRKFIYFGYAATIALLISFGYFFNNTNNSIETTPIVIVEETSSQKETLEEFHLKNTENRETSNEEIVFETQKRELKKEIPSEIQKDFYTNLENEEFTKLSLQEIIVPEKKLDLDIDSKEITVAIDVNSKMDTLPDYLAIDASALLESVTNELSLENKEQSYALETQEKLELIREEFQKYKIDFSAEDLLAEIEQDINDERTFKDKILIAIQKHFPTLKTAIVDRTK